MVINSQNGEDPNKGEREGREIKSITHNDNCVTKVSVYQEM